jgi:23S rRNA pseudouridine2605 synthase
MPEERLQKIIAAAGIASRRKAEELITQGRVSVNGHIASELGSKADPSADRITVDGKPLHLPDQHVYLLLNKPRGYVSTASDPEGRPTVLDLVKSVRARVFPVGRLDYASEGLLLLTNDGELTQKLTHASSHVPKTYLVKVSGKPSDDAIEKLRRGIRIGGAPNPKFRARLKAVTTAPAHIKLFRAGDNPWYEVTLIEGRNRQIRRMFEQVGHNVEKIKRVRYGALELNVEPGQFRHLTGAEVSALRRGSSSRPAAAPSRPRPRRDFRSEARAGRDKKKSKR